MDRKAVTIAELACQKNVRFSVSFDVWTSRMSRYT